MNKTIFVAAAALVLAGCTSPQEAATQSGFRTPNADGFITNGFDPFPNRRASKVEDTQGDGYAYTVGRNAQEGEGFSGAASLLPDSRVRTQPTRGSATYSARYNVGMIEGISLSGDFLSGRFAEDSGNITLRANFDDNTLRGASGDLRVRGALNDDSNRFGGFVTYRGVRGDLRGLAGSDEVVGAFTGDSETLIYSGGFLGDLR